jgi:hypothetical protein
MSSRRKTLLSPEEYPAAERRSEARSEYLAGASRAATPADF